MNKDLPAAAPFSASGVTWLRLGVLYLLLGIAIGMGMGVTHDFTLRPVHAHVNLLGWTTSALAGLVYLAFPAAAASRLGRAHFWLHNLGAPAMLIALAFIVTGKQAFGPLWAVGALAIALGVGAFLANLFVNVRR
jgi:hypothetical protein